jgi:subtilisin family serine protease
VEWATPDWVYTGHKLSQAPVPNDPLFASQYFLENPFAYNGIRVDVRARAAWLVNRGGGIISGGGMVVAVLDDGVAASNPDLAGRVLTGYDAFGNNTVGCSDCANNPAYNDSHGTSVSGIIAANRNNGLGGTGVAPEATILPIRIFKNFTATGGLTPATDAQMAAAINYAWSSGAAQILSNSWGAGCDYASNSPTAVNITNAINSAATSGRGGKGAIVVFSAGNTAHRSIGQPGCVTYPATLANVIAVGAISQYGLVSDYSPQSSRIDIVAPTSPTVTTASGGTLPCPLAGDQVTTSNPNRICLANTVGGDANYENNFGGTSGAAPQVAAAAAVLLTDSPTMTRVQVRDRIKLRAVPWGAAQDVGSGKLDVFRVVRSDLTAAIAGRTIVLPGNQTYTASASGGIGPYSYRWYQSYSDGSGSFFDTGNTSTTLTQNFVSGDVITFRLVASDAAGNVVQVQKTAYGQ